MKRALILGAGTAGTMMANKLVKRLDMHEWEVMVVDRNDVHYYQPGFLFIPFGTYSPKDVVKAKSSFISKKAKLKFGEITKVDANANTVEVGGELVSYDILIVATGTIPTPSETPGLLGDRWYKNIFDFYTYEGAVALYEHLKEFKGGKLVMSITELPYKCPIAPLEFVFLADEFFKKKGIRDKVEITYTTPMSGAFTKPVATKLLSSLLEEKQIHVSTDFYVEGVEEDRNTLKSYDGREVDFDTLVVVPVNMGDRIWESTGLADDLNYVQVDKHTMQSVSKSNIFAIGDAANLPTSKAGSVAHFAAEVLLENVVGYAKGVIPSHKFDGHANCFIETGFGKATLIDFDYNTEPLPGVYPYPTIGPLKLLGNTTLNHWGKLAFKPIYWEFLMKDRKLPVSSSFSLAGKKLK